MSEFTEDYKSENDVEFTAREQWNYSCINKQKKNDYV